MDYLVQFQINIFALMILFILYFIVRMSKIKTFGKRLIRWITATTTIAIILEPLTWIFDGMQFTGAFFLEYSSNFFLFLIGPIIGGLLLSYVDYRIYKKPKRIAKKLYYQHASIATCVILLINIFIPVYFQVDIETNSFSSREWKEWHYVILGSLYIYMFLFLLMNRKKVQFHEATIFIVCFFLPVIGMIVQLFDSKLHFSWTSIVLGIFVAYIFLETASTEEDHLTKLFNRQSYETYLNYLMEHRQSFGVTLIDLNYFKIINDDFGHAKGDEVLMYFALLLKKVFSNNGFVGRLGGDEFVVISNSTEEEMFTYMNELNEQLKLVDNKLVKNLSFSYGYQYYTPNMTIDELYMSADKKMYQNKHSMKETKVR
ncbi:GGDEF domain-containing protein [Gracilibacillus marinus]|uniref:GGDEF domain-containing protein n=1 Tax=Gracilibacillus marinus TaxID=630535 RepID=A0ABV8VYD6_9BACI